MTTQFNKLDPASKILAEQVASWRKEIARLQDLLATAEPASAQDEKLAAEASFKQHSVEHSAVLGMPALSPRPTFMYGFKAGAQWQASRRAAPQSVFPERDQSKLAEHQGIFRKFEVRRVDGSDAPGGKHYGCRYFVLDMDHDENVAAALQAYGYRCKDKHPQLSAELLAEFCQAAPSDLHALTTNPVDGQKVWNVDGKKSDLHAAIFALYRPQEWLLDIPAIHWESCKISYMRALQAAADLVNGAAPVQNAVVVPVKFQEALWHIQNLVAHDSYETEYDGQMLTICPSCGDQDRKHGDQCEFVKANKFLAAHQQEQK